MGHTVLLAAVVVSASLERSRLPAVADMEEGLARAAVAGGAGESLVQTALFAGNREDRQRVDRLLRRYDAWLDSLAAARPPLPQNRNERMAALFARMHSDLLTGDYRAHTSDVGVTLETGDFNCLTATILFVSATRHFDVSVEPMATAGHVFCQTAGDDAPRRIETTCARWFELPAADRSIEVESNIAAQASAPGAGVSRPLTDAQLIAKVYYNRGVAHFRQNNFRRGIELTRRSLQLDPDDAVARSNVLAGLNNWALARCRQGEFPQALELMEQIRTINPDYPTLEENVAHIYRCWGDDGQGGRITTTGDDDAGGYLPPAELSGAENLRQSHLLWGRVRPIY